MKIEEIEYTPNPNAVKFILDTPLTTGGMTRSFESPEQAAEVPLARAILDIEHVTSVFFADRWVTVTQDGQAEWPQLMRAVAEPMRQATRDDAAADHTTAGTEGGEAFEQEGVGLDDPRIAMIREIIDEQIMPYLQFDGGGLEIKALVENQLMIRYQGACGTCPASVTGTLMAIENLLQAEVDPELEVVSV